jgi:phosphoenolpyruvate synthase/pyruvate phosphate dikinase
MLEKIINSKTRLAILNLFFDNKDKEFYGREVSNELKLDQASVHKEIKNLTDSGILISKKKSGKKVYFIDKESVYFEGLEKLFKAYSEKLNEDKWFVFLEMPNYYPMMVEPAVNVGCVQECFELLDLKSNITEMVTKYENDYTAVLFIKKEFKVAAHDILDALIKNNKVSNNYFAMIYDGVKEFTKVSDDFERLNLLDLSDRELYKVFDKYYSQYADLIGLHWVQTLSDFEDNVISKYLMNYLKDKIADNKKYSLGDVFSTLTTPTKETNATKEYQSLLKILQYIEGQASLRRYIKNTEIRILIDELSDRDSKLDKMLERHAKRFGWMGYNTIGPSWKKDYFLDILASMIRQGEKSSKLLKKIEEETRGTRAKQRELFNDLGISREYRKVFEIAQELVHTKSIRKDAMFRGYFIMENFFREIGRRFHMSIKQARYMHRSEYNDLLLKGVIDIEKINSRIKYGVFCSKKSKDIFIEGQKAMKFFESLDIIKENLEDVSVMLGDCASPGRVRGSVSVVNVIEDMKKMKEGNVLVSIATTPDLVPAIKKASAIVTDLGGITCHAAIVSREFGIPCVIGTKFSTKVLNDGDVVDVDATHGKISIIERAK